MQLENVVAEDIAILVVCGKDSGTKLAYLESQSTTTKMTVYH